MTRFVRFRTVALVALGLAVLLVPSLALAEEGGQVQDLLQKGWLWAFGGAFVAGVVTSLTPCVYPMIPITIAIFGAKDAPRLRAMFLATMYVLGMSLMFAGLGTAAALASQGSTGILSNPWVVFPIVIFYVVLAASMFGAFELQLPASWQARLVKVGGKGTWGAFTMGMVGGLTAAPCTGPILLGLLLLVGAGTVGVPMGFALLFTYGLGLGVLIWVVAVFAVILPKSGPWMEGIKTVGGIALLNVGLYFLRPVVPALVRASSASTEYLAVSGLLVVAGLVLGALHLSFHGAVKVKVRKGVAVALTVIGIAGIVGWKLTPARKPGWFHDEQAAREQAKGLAAPMLVDFGAEWCPPCKEYETSIFSDEKVHAEITKRFVALKFDVSQQTQDDVAAQKRWEAHVLPTVILLDSTGREARRFGEPIPSPEEFLQALKQLD